MIRRVFNSLNQGVVEECSAYMLERGDVVCEDAEGESASFSAADAEEGRSGHNGIDETPLSTRVPWSKGHHGDYGPDYA